MESRTSKDCAELIELINRATRDSLNIAQIILKNNQEIDIPNLSILQQCVEQSLRHKSNRELSGQVRKIKKEIIQRLVSIYTAIKV